MSRPRGRRRKAGMPTLVGTDWKASTRSVPGIEKGISGPGLVNRPRHPTLVRARASARKRLRGVGSAARTRGVKSGRPDHPQVRTRLSAYSLDTVVLPRFVTQIWAPSKAASVGSVPTVKVPRVAPVLASNSVTVVLLKSVTQMLAPSKQIPLGPDPAGNVPSTVPSLALSLVTLLLPKFDVQMFAPSKATAEGSIPVLKVPSK